MSPFDVKACLCEAADRGSEQLAYLLFPRWEMNGRTANADYYCT